MDDGNSKENIYEAKLERKFQFSWQDKFLGLTYAMIQCQLKAYCLRFC